MTNENDIFIFYVNGVKVEDPCLDPGFTLLQYLREKLRLPGTKLGCGEGGCGACTVMVSKYFPHTEQVKHYTVNACLAPIATMHGLAVTTTEGIGSTRTGLHPVQERLAKAHGSQCGFCTPGFVMSMYTLLRNNPKPSMEEVEENLVGNLCRCTGYRPILEGFRTFTQQDRNNVTNSCGRKDCCKLQNGPNCQNGQLPAVNGDCNLERTGVLYDPSSFAPYDPSQDVIFPPDLKLNSHLQKESCTFRGPNTTFFRPSTFEELLQLKQVYNEAKIVVGNTEVGIEVKFKNQEYPVIIHPVNIPELQVLKMEESYVEVGSAVCLSDLEEFLKKVIKKLPGYKIRVLKAIVEILRWFAGRQIRNVAAIGGNIMTGSPISDLNPILMASGSKLTFCCVGNEREIDFDDKFFTGYRRNCARKDEVLKSIKIPLTSENEHFFAYKQARRRDDDIAIVNSGMKVKIKHQNRNFIVESLALAFGGMAPTTIMAKNTMEKLTGMSLTDEMLDKALMSLLDELELDPSAPGGMTDYRRALTASFFFKFYHQVRQELNESFPEYFDSSNQLKESFKNYESLPTSSTQFFQNVPENQEKIDPVGRPIPHLSSLKQASGEAEYIDDIPRFENELYAGLVMSSRAKAKIIKIDESEALALEGVEAFVSAKDIPGTNRQGPSDECSEEIIASDQVHFIGQIIGVVVAQNQKLAQKAAKLVKITYEDLLDPIFTIEDAIAAKSMWKPYVIETGDVAKAFEKVDHVLEGKTYLGGQEHFYMETNVHIAIPHEGNEIEIIGSTQSPQITQECVAVALGIPSHFVTCRTRRIGGGFGGKETRTKMISTPLAIAAAKVRRPIRIVVDRDEDMIITGGRHPFLGCWKVGFNKGGKIDALDICLYSNAGYSFDLSGGVMYRAVFSIDNVYRIKNFKVYGYCCRTNLPSNTAYRGFGTPQACFIIEDIMARVSEYIQIHPNTVRERNFYEDNGEVTHFGQPLGECQARRCWDQVISSSCYSERELQVTEFNRNNTYKKRGISAIPCKFAVAFGIPFLNQGGALVLIYKDGSALVSIGGTEMGQGLYTKIIQIVSRVLKIHIDKVYIQETTTSTVPNASPTAASASSDIYGMAVLDACQKLLQRLKPIQEKHPESSWEDVIKTAYSESISLFATGYHQMPNLQPYSLEKRKGAPFRYFTYGAAVAEVEIDCLTGDHTVLQTDIVIDVGNSLNPAIDIGQIEGAFLQGYGLFTIEQLVYSRSGALLSKGPGTYKIPSIMDIPRVFNVSLLRDSSNPKAIFSSKAVGEPPFFSGSSVYFALREAIKSTSDSEDFRDGSFFLASPATAERIRMACKDKIIKLVNPIKENINKSWNLNI